MIMGRFPARGILIWSAGALVVLVIAGGSLLAVVESISSMAGIWLAFNVISTTGFGPGAQTTAGQLMSMGLFLVAATCWFGVLVSAIEISNMRLQRHALVDEALRPLGRRPKSRLFHVN